MRPEVVFLLEEESAKAMLQGVMPRLANDLPVRYIVFEGKQDLERQLERKLKGYLNPDARFIVLRDQDATPDCRALKRSLLTKCQKSKRPAKVRIACRELESFYLGDLRAVEEGLGKTGLARKQTSNKFREPDRLHSPSKELERLTGGVYQKVSGSRAIGPHLDLNHSRSASFRNLIQAIRQSSRGGS